MRIVGLGDIMPGGVLNGSDKAYATQEVFDVLSFGDVRVGTLETAIGNSPTFYDEKMKRKADVIYAKDDDIFKLVEMGVDIVSLANNHFFDLGPDGAFHTIQLLDSLGIKHIGAGRNIEEASRPAVVEKEGRSYAFIAFCDWREESTGWCPFAAEESAGVNPMFEDYVLSEIRKNKKKFDYVVVMPHWGKEYDCKPVAYVHDLVMKMIEAGANAILGGHTHSAQPSMIIRGTAVVYSLGNFLFPDRLICPPRSTYYPETPLDLESLPRSYGYPYVTETTLKLWNDIGRHGQIVTIDISGGTVTEHHDYTYLDYDNKISISPLPIKYRIKLFVVKSVIRTGLYSRVLNLYSRIAG